MRTKQLSDLVELYRGYPFRGRIEPTDQGDVNVIQLRDTHPNGYIIPDEIIKTNLPGKKDPDWLQQGDVLFAAKGASFYAILVEDIAERTICAPQFYLLRVKNHLKDQVIPEFIGWQLNQIPVQRHFEKTAEGSIHLSIRRKVLENAPITMLPIDQQREIAGLYISTLQEQRVLNALIQNRQQQLQALALNVLAN